MRPQTTNNTTDKYILSFPPNDTGQTISDRFLTAEKQFSIHERIQYSPSVISLLDKSPIVSSNISAENMSSSETHKIGGIEQSRIFKISVLPTKKLKEPIESIIESDDEGYIIRTIDLPLYGYGDDPIEAIQNLKYEIESLYDELMEDDNFSDEWLRYKSYLKNIICEYYEEC